jgi:hypothetical protein
MERRVDDPLRALDPDNMQFLVIGDNTNIENLPRRVPALRQ